MGHGPGVCQTLADGVSSPSVAGNEAAARRFKGDAPHRVARSQDGRVRRSAAADGSVVRARGAARLIDARQPAVIGAVHHVGLGLPLDDRLVDHDPGHVTHRGQLVHGIEQHGFEDGAQAPRPGLSLHGAVGRRAQRLVAELELGALHLEQAPVLLGEGVLGLGEDRDQGLFVELIERRYHRQAPDELRDQAVLDQVLGLDVVEQVAAVRAVIDVAHLGGEADTALLGAVQDDLLQSREGAAADEQDVAGVDLQELLLRVLAAALRRHRGDRALDELQQRLLHALARDVAGDRGVVGLTRDLVDLIDVDDAGLRFLDVVVALLQQLLDDVLDVLADVAGLGERGRVRDGERYVEQARQRLREQGLAAPRRADQQNVALGDLDLVLGARGGGAGLHATVAVVDRDREHLLGALLADDVLVEHLLYFVGLGKLVTRAFGAVLELLTDDVVAQLDAFVAHEHRRAGDQLAHLVLTLPAEGAVQELAVVMAAAGVFTHRGLSLNSRRATSRGHVERQFLIARRPAMKQSARAQLSSSTHASYMTWFTSLTFARVGRGNRANHAGFPGVGAATWPRCSRTLSISP